MGGRARTTTRAPDGKAETRSTRRCRSWRRTRLRVTAPPTRRPTITPTRGHCDGSGSIATETIREPRAARLPVRATAEKSARERIRNEDGSTEDSDDRWSGGEAMPPLCPSGGDYRPPGARTHPHPEAVGLGPVPVVRLVGALTHDNSGSQGQSREGTQVSLPDMPIINPKPGPSTGPWVAPRLHRSLDAAVKRPHPVENLDEPGKRC